MLPFDHLQRDPQVAEDRHDLIVMQGWSEFLNRTVGLPGAYLVRLANSEMLGPMDSSG